MLNDKNTASLATYLKYKTRSSLHCANNHYITVLQKNIANNG